MYIYIYIFFWKITYIFNLKSNIKYSSVYIIYVSFLDWFIFWMFVYFFNFFIEPCAPTLTVQKSHGASIIGQSPKLNFDEFSELKTEKAH